MDKEPNNDARRLTAGAGSIKEAIELREHCRDIVDKIDAASGSAAGLPIALSSLNVQGLGTSAESEFKKSTSPAAAADDTPTKSTNDSNEESKEMSDF